MEDKTTFERIDELAKRQTSIRTAIRNLSRTEDGRKSKGYEARLDEAIKVSFQILVLFTKLKAESVAPGTKENLASTLKEIDDFLDGVPSQIFDFGTAARKKVMETLGKLKIFAEDTVQRFREFDEESIMEIFKSTQNLIKAGFPEPYAARIMLPAVRRWFRGGVKIHSISAKESKLLYKKFKEIQDQGEATIDEILDSISKLAMKRIFGK
jgi:hypothetical protein